MGEDSLLKDNGAKYCKKLATIVPRYKGDTISGYWGTFRARLSASGGAEKKLDVIKLTEIPGSWIPLDFCVCLLLFFFFFFFSFFFFASVRSNPSYSVLVWLQARLQGS